MPTSYSAILAHPQQPRLLLLTTANGYALPQTVQEKGWYAEVKPIAEAFSETLGAQVVIRRCIHRLRSAEADEAHCLMDCECLTPGWQPPANSLWAGRREMESLNVAPEMRAALADWFAENEGSRPLPEQRVPWGRPGWFFEADQWIETQLAALGLAAIGPFEPLKTWSISCLLRVPTTGGDCYFKAVPAYFRQEPPITRFLASLYPEILPIVAATDSGRYWLLMRAFQGEPMRQIADVTLWEEAAHRFARLQVDCITRPESLLQCGCMVRSLSLLPAQFATLLSELASPETRAFYRLTEAETEALGTLEDRIQEQCDALTAFAIPETLLHGDLHAGNIVVHDHAPLFFDWTDGAVGPPFFDMLTFLNREDCPPSLEGEDMRLRLRNAYLEPWAAHAPLEALVRAFELSQSLAPVYHAFSYRNIAVNTEPASRWELAGGVGYFLKMLLPQDSPLPGLGEG